MQVPRAIKNRVVIEHDPNREFWDELGMLYIPDHIRNPRVSRVGTVVSIGPKCELPLELGDRVIYQGSWTGAPIELDGKLFRVLEQEDCAAIVAPDASIRNMEL